MKPLSIIVSVIPLKLHYHIIELIGNSIELYNRYIDRFLHNKNNTCTTIQPCDSVCILLQFHNVHTAH